MVAVASATAQNDVLDPPVVLPTATVCDSPIMDDWFEGVCTSGDGKKPAEKVVELLDSIDLVDDLLLLLLLFVWLFGLSRFADAAWSMFDFDLTIAFALLKYDGELERTRRDLVGGAAKYVSFLTLVVIVAATFAPVVESRGELVELGVLVFVESCCWLLLVGGEENPPHADKWIRGEDSSLCAAPLDAGGLDGYAICENDFDTPNVCVGVACSL